MVKSVRLPAYQTRVEGLVLPVAVADHPALEFCNSWAGWDSSGRELPEGRDYLESWDHLVALTLHRGLLPADPWSGLLAGPNSVNAGLGNRVLAVVPRLRASAYRTLRGLASAADLDLLGRLAAEARTHQTLVMEGGRGRWVLGPTASARAPLLAAASATAELFTTGEATRVEACGGDGCGWLFLNRSGRRRWCLMSVCGNRAKVRAFAARQH